MCVAKTRGIYRTKCSIDFGWHATVTMRRSSFATSFDSQDRIPPRGPTRETEGRSSTTSIVLQSSHPVMEMWDQVFQSSVTSGRLIGPLEGVSSYRLCLIV